MSNEKISSLDLISAISAQSGTTKKVATTFIRQFTETVEAALLRDGIVKIKGFGTFKIIWNESRSSINVNTGERYEIAGHNKITFTPDEEVSVIVNRPYAHLESIDMEGNATNSTTDQVEEDPHMKRFSEQASEIVSMIADMQAFKPKKKSKQVIADTLQDNAATEIITTQVEPEIPPQEILQTEEVVSPADNIIAESATAIAQEIHEEAEPEQVPAETPVVAQAGQQTPAATSAPQASSKIPEETATVAPVEQPVSESDLIERMSAQPEQKSYKWLYISLIIVVILGGAATACYFFLPDLFTQHQEQKQSAIKPAATIKPAVKVNAVKPDTTNTPKAAPVKAKAEQQSKVQPKPEAEANTQPKDVFAAPRVYKEFIATETASEGTWLTMLSLKYYGHKLFWVYIYEANKDKLHNPGVLPPGTKIKIPKLDPRLIDKHNGRCFRQASELQTRYTTQQ